MLRLIALPFALGICFASTCLAAPTPADVVTVDTGSVAPGASIDIAVYIRDSSGTAIGIDQPSGSRIQSYSIKVDYAPAADVQTVAFTRAGISAPLTPSFESSPAAAGSVSLIDSFSETTNLSPFTSNAALPGNQIGVLHFTLAASAAISDTITLTLDSTSTQLSNEAGTTHESTSSADLMLVNGSILVIPATPARLESFEVR